MKFSKDYTMPVFPRRFSGHDIWTDFDNEWWITAFCQAEEWIRLTGDLAFAALERAHKEGFDPVNFIRRLEKIEKMKQKLMNTLEEYEAIHGELDRSQTRFFKQLPCKHHFWKQYDDKFKCDMVGVIRTKRDEWIPCFAPEVENPMDVLPDTQYPQFPSVLFSRLVKYHDRIPYKNSVKAKNREFKTNRLKRLAAEEAERTKRNSPVIASQIEEPPTPTQPRVGTRRIVTLK